MKSNSGSTLPKKPVGRPRLWFSDGELKMAHAILSVPIKKPLECICGNLSYVYGVYSGSGIVAKCVGCGYRRRYNPYSEEWGPRRE